MFDEHIRRKDHEIEKKDTEIEKKDNKIAMMQWQLQWQYGECWAVVDNS
jgi:hypothetical protein